ncbi:MULTISPECIES: HIT family protein [Saccharothrix]|uniref:HIT family protein n=1 Tax=Saccharothrix TaxID=2071 RepID=UPI00093FA79D|nr:HIT family protein [Saccharothrix sp. CB00851]OKI15512.1 HIT family hydrolase [Saccharothrix sp. CB00851]
MTRAVWDEESYLDLVRRACFICEMLAGNPDYPHHVAHRDERAVVFLSRFPFMWGHLLVAPVEHREHVIGDFPLDDYLALQRVVHAAGTALTAAVPTERLYLLSFGSQQGNRHTHWHLAPLPPGVPYEHQQFAAFSAALGPYDFPERDLAHLAAELGRRLREIFVD